MKWFISIFTLILLITDTYATSIEVDEVARRHGLDLVAKGDPWTFTGVNKVYSDQFLDRAIMAIENIEGVKKELTLTQMGEHVIVEYPTSETTYSSLLFYHFTVSELSYLKTKKTSFLKTIIDNLNPMPKAHAQFLNNNNCQGNYDFRNPFQATGLQTSSIAPLIQQNDTSYWQMASSCMMGVLQGVWDSTGGLVTSIAEGLKQLWDNPKKFWNDKVQQFDKLKSFLGNFDTEIKKLGKAFMDLPSTMKAEIFCGFIGGIGTDILIGVLTAGGSLAPAMVKMTSYVNKVLRITELLNKLAKIGKLADLPADFFKKLMKAGDAVADRVTSGMQKFSRNKMDDFALGYAQCAL